MELLGIWKLKDMLSVDENGFKRISAEEIEAMEDNDDSHEYKQMVRADFIITEDSLSVYYMPTKDELAIVKEEGWEITDKGIMLDSFPCKIADGVLMLNYERDGKDYFPVEVDEEGCLSISDGLIKIKKA